MNFNPLRESLYSSAFLFVEREQEGGFREIHQTCEAELWAGLPYITIPCLC